MNRCALPALALVTLVVLAVAGPRCASATDMSGVEDPIPAEYAAASAVVGGLNLTTTYFNMGSHGADLSPSWTRYAGVLGGLAGIGLGGTLLVEDKYEDAATLGFSNLLLGTVATIGGLSSITRARKASGEASVHYDPRHVSISPAFHGGMAPGVGVRLRF